MLRLVELLCALTCGVTAAVFYGLGEVERAIFFMLVAIFWNMNSPKGGKNG